MTKTEIELRDLKESLVDTQPIGSIVKCTKTLDQVNQVYDITLNKLGIIRSLDFNALGNYFIKAGVDMEAMKLHIISLPVKSRARGIPFWNLLLFYHGFYNACALIVLLGYFNFYNNFRLFSSIRLLSLVVAIAIT